MTARVFWQMNPGRNVVNLNWDVITADSVVMVSASEYNSKSQKLPDGTDQRFIGAADVTVANVTPHGPPFDTNHGVTYVVEVGWKSPLTICTDIAVVANTPNTVVFVGPGTQSSDESAGSSSATASHKVRTEIESHQLRSHSSTQANGSGSAVTYHEARIG